MTPLLRLVRRLATAPGFRRLTEVGPLLRVSFALRASLVDERLRFALNELRPGGRTRTYRLRDSDVAISLRHHTPDVLVLDEVIGQDEYAWPPEIAAALPADRPPRVVDLGANIGLFGAHVLRAHPRAEITAVEPDAANAAVLRATIAANGGLADWRVVEACAATEAGEMRFAGGGFALSHVDEAAATTVPAVDVFTLLGGADLLKVDVEGAEWPILEDARLETSGPPLLVLEYHREGSPGTDPLAEATQLLRAAGYEVLPTRAKPEFGTGVLWASRARPRASRDRP